jgi:hypothetical protein
MPTIRRFANCKIAIYANDHAPPHFHIEGRGFRIVIEISTMAILTGKKRDFAKAGEAIQWAELNTTFLKAEWTRINQRDQA